MDILSYILGKKAGGGGGEAVLVNKNIDANGTYNASADSADGYKKVTVAVPNTYGASDEGKVVSDGALVSQGSDTVTENDTYDTTLISEMVVNVPNSYTAADEGKVVDNGALVAQGSATYTANGTYDTTLVNAVEVAIGGGNFESGTYIGADTGNRVRQISTTKKWSHFLIVSAATFSQLTTQTACDLYMAYADENGYTIVPIKTTDGGYGNLAVMNRLPASYDNWRSQITFGDNYIKWAFFGNGAIATPVTGATYVWYAW